MARVATGLRQPSPAAFFESDFAPDGALVEISTRVYGPRPAEMITYPASGGQESLLLWTRMDSLLGIEVDERVAVRGRVCGSVELPMASLIAMSYPSGPSDPLFQSLDPLVHRGVLNQAQANEVYAAVSRDRAVPPGATTDTDRPEPAGWQLPRLFAGLAVFGASILLAALSIASFNAQGGVAGATADTSADDFTWKPFLIMAGITLLLGGLAVAAHLLLASRLHKRLVASVFVAFALIALVVTIGATWEGDALVYLGGLLMLVGGVAGFWYFKGQVLVAVAVLGGLVLIAQLVSDTLDSFDGGSGTVLSTGMVFLAYGLVVAAAGWRFSCRTVAAMLGGGIALTAMWVTVVAIGFLAVAAVFSGPQASAPDGIRTDIRIAMVLGLLVAVALVIAYVFTSYSGYLILAFVGAVTLPGTAVALTVSAHPLRWSILFAVLGAVLAAAPVAMLWRHQRGQATSSSRDSQPSQPNGSTPQGPPPSYQGRG